MDLLATLIELATTLDKTGKYELAGQVDILIKQAKKALDDKIKERFWAKVDKTPTCWLWRGALTTSGYPICTINGKNYGGHILSWQWAHNKKVPKGLVLLHSCDQRICINPGHLTP